MAEDKSNFEEFFNSHFDTDKVAKDLYEDPRGYTQERIGHDAVERLVGDSEQFEFAILRKAIKIQEEGGDVEKYLETMRDFTNSLSTRLPNNHLDEEPFMIAIEGSTAILTPAKHSGLGYKEKAQKMVDALRERYSLD